MTRIDTGNWNNLHINLCVLNDQTISMSKDRFNIRSQGKNSNSWPLGVPVKCEWKWKRRIETNLKEPKQSKSNGTKNNQTNPCQSSPNQITVSAKYCFKTFFNKTKIWQGVFISPYISTSLRSLNVCALCEKVTPRDTAFYE